MKPPVAPPYEVQTRASECAWVLSQDFADRLPIRERVAVEVVVRMHPDRLGWSECSSMFRLYRAVAGVRV